MSQRRSGGESALLVLLDNEPPMKAIAALCALCVDDCDAVRFAGKEEDVLAVRMYLMEHNYAASLDWITLPYDCLLGGYKQLVVTRRQRSSSSGSPSSPHFQPPSPRRLTEAVSKMTLQS